MTKKMIFVTDDCPICKKAKEIGIPESYEVFDDEFPVDRMAEAAFYDVRSFPVIIIDDNDTITRYVGEEVLEYLRKGEKHG